MLTLTRRLPIFSLVGLGLLLGACSNIESPGPSSPRTSGTLAYISDAAHGGNQHFFFLPPAVAQPVYNGTFDPALAPEVTICVYDARSGCTSTIARYTTGSGPGSETVRLDAADELYIVNWHTDQFAVDPYSVYRILVSVGQVSLGYADVQVLTTAQQAKNVQTSQYIPLVDGHTLPIKVRIEQGIVGSIVVSPTRATLTAGQTLQLVASSYDLHGHALSNQPATWSTSAPGVATIDETGLVTAVSAGTAILTATSGSASATASVTVTPASCGASGLSSMPVAVDLAGYGVIDEKLFIAGGYDGANSTATVQIFDPATSSWSLGTPMPTSRSHGASAVINGILYVAGGTLVTAHANGPKQATLEAYNPVTCAWISRAPMSVGRVAMAGAALGGLFYVAGGHDGTNNLSLMEAYDPASNKWMTKAAMPTARYGPTAAVLNGILYVVGGYVFNGSANIPLSTVEAYDPSTDRWSTKASLATPRFEPGLVAFNGKLYAFGGYNFGLLPSVEAYDPATDSWSGAGYLTVSVWGTQTALVNGTTYLVGGAIDGDGSAVPAVQIYNP